ncbi:hypothetical protein GCM10009425_17660 [Pseudomonas asuensis]|jgi:hypothetical protein|uniref:Uncharacterized protein n=1 Tax=Pseudomonas asuensis TaxID=1825787 RepID=A0ABQ2GPI8_9PSED|nr:hypothetical protein GCM10009425_17660 [Pseudomonas asuensis]
MQVSLAAPEESIAQKIVYQRLTSAIRIKSYATLSSSFERPSRYKLELTVCRLELLKKKRGSLYGIVQGAEVGPRFETC